MAGAMGSRQSAVVIDRFWRAEKFHYYGWVVTWKRDDLGERFYRAWIRLNQYGRVCYTVGVATGAEAEGVRALADFAASGFADPRGRFGTKDSEWRQILCEALASVMNEHGFRLRSFNDEIAVQDVGARIDPRIKSGDGHDGGVAA